MNEHTPTPGVIRKSKPGTAGQWVDVVRRAGGAVKATLIMALIERARAGATTITAGELAAAAMISRRRVKRLISQLPGVRCHHAGRAGWRFTLDPATWPEAHNAQHKTQQPVVKTHHWNGSGIAPIPENGDENTPNHHGEAGRNDDGNSLISGGNEVGNGLISGGNEVENGLISGGNEVENGLISGSAPSPPYPPTLACANAITRSLEEKQPTAVQPTAVQPTAVQPIAYRCYGFNTARARERQQPAVQQPADQPSADQPPPADQPPVDQPPADQPPAVQQPAVQQPAVNGGVTVHQNAAQSLQDGLERVLIVGGILTHQGGVKNAPESILGALAGTSEVFSCTASFASPHHNVAASISPMDPWNSTTNTTAASYMLPLPSYLAGNTAAPWEAGALQVCEPTAAICVNSAAKQARINQASNQDDAHGPGPSDTAACGNAESLVRINKRGQHRGSKTGLPAGDQVLAQINSKPKGARATSLARELVNRFARLYREHWNRTYAVRAADLTYAQRLVAMGVRPGHLECVLPGVWRFGGFAARHSLSIRDLVVHWNELQVASERYRPAANDLPRVTPLVRDMLSSDQAELERQIREFGESATGHSQ